jgi:hypothetical protein
MILTAELTWKPNAQQIAWAKTLLNGLEQHGVIITPYGVYIVDHETKTIALKIKTACFSLVVFDKMQRTFKVLGYTVIDGTEVKQNAAR